MGKLGPAGKSWVRRNGRHFWMPIGALVTLVFLLSGTGAAAAWSTPPAGSPPYTVLDTIPLVDAIAANSSMVFAQGVANCSDIWGIAPNGTVSLYATVPIPNTACDEGALALAPNTTYTGHGSSGGGPPPAPTSADQALGEWRGGCHHHCAPSNTTLFDVVAGNLFAITDDGATVTQVASFPISDKTSENMGLAWDQVGLFNHTLIVTSSSGGDVWLVNSTGTVTLLVKLHTYIGGPAVAPLSFGPFGGDIVIAEKSRGEIVAVSPSGSVTFVANWSKANAVTFPFGSEHGHPSWGEWGSEGGCAPGCTFGTGHDVLFVANYSSGAVEAFPASDLRGYGGDGFVAGGQNQGIGAFAANGTTRYFATETQRLSDISSIYCPPPCPSSGREGGSYWGTVRGT